MNAAASLLLAICPDFEIYAAGRKGIEEGRYHIDARLVADLYTSCPDKLKLVIADSLAFRRLPPATFRRLFLDAWHLKSLTVGQRHSLALVLEGFVARSPAHAEANRDLILELLWSRYMTLCLRGVYQIGYLNDLEPRDLERLKDKLATGSVYIRMNALNGLCILTKRYKELSPRLLAFCTSDEVRALARRIASSDRDKDARTCAYYFLKALFRYDEAVGALPSQRARKRPAR